MKLKRILVFLLAVITVTVLLLTAISCGEENTPTVTDSESESTTVTTATEASSTETKPVETTASSSAETSATETETSATETETEAETETSATETETEAETETSATETETETETETSATETETETETSATETETETTNLTEMYPKHSEYTDLDFAGKTFKVVYVWAPSTLKPSGYGATYDIFENPDNPDEVITAAAALRVNLIQTYYNCKVVGVPAVEAMSAANTAIDTHSNDFDLVLGSGSVSSYITSNRYYNILSLVDTSKSYYDQSMIRDLAVGGKLYAITGDMSIADDGGFWVLFFNKDILASNNLESPYELVMNKKWTVDKMMQMAAIAAKDLDGDNTISNAQGKDIYGFVTHLDHARSAWIGAGLRLASPVNSDGRYTIAAASNDSGADIYQKVIDLMGMDETGVANKEGWGVPDGLRSIFIGKRALFYGECLGNIGEPCGELIGVGLGLKDYDGLNFGIIPQPMFNEEQGNYYSFSRTVVFYGVPSTTDIATAGRFLDVWAFHGQQTVQKAYIQQVARGWTSDEEIVDMMDIIIHNAVWDAGYFYDSAALDASLITDIGQLNNRYSQRMKKGVSKLEASLDKIYNEVIKFSH